MQWREYFNQSNEAVELEKRLEGQFQLVEHDAGMASTANTDVTGNIKVINLDTSQAPFKCALSYAYELKNLDNAKKYKELIEKAQKHNISKSSFVKETIKVEAEAAYFRSKLFLAFGKKRETFPYNKEYLRIFDETKGLKKEEIIEKFAQHILENGIVRRQFAAKKYYADSFDYYAGKKPWPNFFDRKLEKRTWIKHANDDHFITLEKSKKKNKL